MSLGDGAPAPSTAARDIMAQISSGQKDIYNQNYLPIQKMLQQQIQDPNFIQGIRDKAVQQVGIGAANSRQAAQNTKRRYGITTTPAQKAALDRRFSIAESNTTVNAANQAGRAGYGIQTAGMAGLTDIGHQTAGRSLRTAGAMARLESGRNRFNANVAAEDEAGTISAIGTGLGIAAGFAV